MSCTFAALPFWDAAVSRPRQLHLACFRCQSKSYCVSSRSLPKNAFGWLLNGYGSIMRAKVLYHYPLARAQGLEDGVPQSPLDPKESSLDGCEATRLSTKDVLRPTVNEIRYCFLMIKRGYQCAGCRQYHKFVDNLGLVIEYDFRTEGNTDAEDD